MTIINRYWPYIRYNNLLWLLMLAVIGLIIGLYSMVSWANIHEYDVFSRILISNMLQAIISSVIACILGFICARIVFYNPHLYAGHILKKISALYFVMPSLIMILMVIGIYGNNGLINRVLHAMNIPTISNMIYGYQGVILAHVMINIPLAFWVFYNGYKKIPREYWYISRHLSLSRYRMWCLIEWPLLRKAGVGAFNLIFLYCFMSFAIVLVLGSGFVKTFELSIYQAFYREFNPSKAAFLALVQLLCIAPILLLFFKEQFHYVSQKDDAMYHHAASISRIEIFIIYAVAALYIIPCIWIGDYIIFKANFSLLLDAGLQHAIVTSIILAFLSMVCSFVIVYSMLYQSAYYFHHSVIQRLYNVLPMIFLALPPFILASGYFAISGSFSPVIIPLLLIQTLLLIPLLWRMMHYNIAHSLFHSYVIMRVCRLSYIERNIILLREHKHTIKRALGFGLALALGDFSVIALFGNEGITTLPLYLYNNISHYKIHDAIFSGLVLLSIQGLFFIMAVRRS